MEGCFYNGTSSSHILFDLVLDLCFLKMTFHLYLIHIAGTRMIQSGIDGFSFSDMDTGLMGGTSPLTFVSIHQSAMQCNLKFKPWILSWMPKNSSVLTPKGWFTDGHLKGPLVWDLPPATTDFALDIVYQST